MLSLGALHLPHFPPRSAGASLKPGGCRDGGVQRHGLSPAFCGGLIEAVRPPPKAARPSTLSPAFCGGLIEASPRGRIPTAAGCYFPPRSAGASLKHALNARQRRLTRHFPPRSAGASLKRQPNRAASSPKRELSPAFCGGLIEASCSLGWTRTALPLSPAFCGGLIEALTFTVSSSYVFTLSPAFCGGLIEARPSRGTANASF